MEKYYAHADSVRVDREGLDYYVELYLAREIEEKMPASVDLVKRIEERDLRIAKLESGLRQWLELDKAISARLELPRGWTIDERAQHGQELFEREKLKDVLQLALTEEGNL